MQTVIIVIILLSLALVVLPRITIQTLTIAGLLMGGLFMIGAKQASDTSVSEVTISTNRAVVAPAPVVNHIKLIPKPTPVPTPTPMSDRYQQCTFSYATMIRGIDMNAPDLQFRAYMAYQDCRGVNPQYSREAHRVSEDLR